MLPLSDGYGELFVCNAQKITVFLYVNNERNLEKTLTRMGGCAIILAY